MASLNVRPTAKKLNAEMTSMGKMKGNDTSPGRSQPKCLFQ